MKKSQVLATLALAFALGLGVVAPVANTYATVSFPAGTTQEQQKAFDADKKAALKAYNNLYKVTAYTGLYGEVEAVTKSLENAAKSNIDLYNDGVWFNGQTKDSINNVIDEFNNYVGYGANELYAYTTDGNGKKVYTRLVDNAKIDQAQLVELSELGDMTDIDAIYKAVKNVYVAATNNSNILEKNYKLSDDVVEKANTASENIAAIAGGWLNTYKTSYSGEANSQFGATPLGYANSNFKSIVDEATYKNLVNGDAWKNAANDAFTENVIRYNLYVTAAKATPKYNYVKPLADAYSDFSKIDSAQVVDYAVAQQYIAALNSAITAYENGTTPAPTETRTITSADGTVTVTGKLPAGTEVKVAKSENKVAAFGDRKYAMYNVTLVNAKGETVTFEGNLTVSIKNPEGIDAAKAGVYFVDAKGNTEKYASTYKDGAFTFTTNHLSLWAIVEDNGETLNTPTSPDTGIIAGAEAGATTTVAMVAGLATALTAAGAGVVAYRNARRSTRK